MKKTLQTGMTLVELMVTLAVFSIIIAAAVPSLRDMMVNNRLTALNNQLVSSLHYIRGEAVKRVYNVTLCVRNDTGTNCTANAGDGFEKGWIAFVNCNPGTNTTPDTGMNVCDHDGDGAAESPEEILLDVIPDVMPGFTITGPAGIRQKINYRPNGNASNIGALTMSLNGTPRYRVKLAMGTGRISSCKVPHGATGC